MTSYIGFGLGPTELWIVLGIFLLLFGHRIPGMARAMGSGIVEFKKGLKDGSGDAAGGDGKGSGDAGAGDGDAVPRDIGSKSAKSQPQDGTTNG